MGPFGQIIEIWLNTLAWMAGLAAGFALLARVMPCNPGMHWWNDRRAVLTDAVYWFIVPLFLRFGRIFMLAIAGALVIGAGDPQALREFFMHGWGPLSRMPLWAQCIGVLLAEDVLLYWIHRFFHTRRPWRFHAVHHSPKTLDWMSTQRFHPVNNLLAFSLVDTLMMAAGFSPASLLALGPFNIIFSALVHANLNWTFGPFKYVLASPVFHRWHHTGVKEGGSKNFAPTFPVLDVLFGTFYMPKGKLPETFGVDDPEFPEGFWGQFMYPFRK